jgi:asparagine synthase (glutamine-hydrolysing)
MCGICGAVAVSDRPPLDERRLTHMRDTLVHRGPDDADNFLGPGVALGSRRLAILDLSPAGRMPMFTADRRYAIVHNGEVYNFADLRKPLEDAGRRFRSAGDTEVLLELYAAEGPAMLERLNGMWALAVWDSVERSLFVARDRLGVKPLYYAVVDGVLFFASEQKALFAAGVPAEFDPGTWSEMLAFRYVAGERTPFKNVRRLLPGHYLVWKDGRIRITRWWSLAERIKARANTGAAEGETAWFRSTFDDSVRLRRIADVPVGVLLSGGLDSSSVAATLGGQSPGRTSSFTVRFREAEFDEGPVARQTAERWGLEPHELFLEGGASRELLAECSWLLDEPLAHGNDAHLHAVAKLARESVTVLLSGEGADETMGGYVRYQPLRFPGMLAASRPLWRAAAAVAARGRAAKLSRYLSVPMRLLPQFNSSDVYPDELAAIGLPAEIDSPHRDQVAEEARRAYPREPVRQAMYYDQHTFLCSLLDRNDRMTMGASIECRVPFLDYRLVEGLAAMPSSRLFAGRRGKRVLRRAVADRLPAAVIRGRKWGFGVPWHDRLRTDPAWRELVTNLPGRSPIAEGPFDAAKLKALVASFLAGDDRSMMLVRQLAMIVLWYEAYFPRAAELARRCA